MVRIVALCGWLASSITRPIDASPLRRLGGRRVGMVVVGLLVAAAGVSIVTGLAQPQPQDVTVDEVMTGAVTHPEGWIRLRGRVIVLEEAPTAEPGEYGLLVDADNALRAIVLRPASAVDPQPSATVTGHLLPAVVAVDEELPLEATVFGTPPQIVGDRIVQLDPVAEPPRVVPWPVALGLIAIAIVLAVGLEAGYPVFRPTREVDVLARPLGPGERLPAAIGGRVGDHEPRLDDPAEALLVTGRGARGPVLMVQLLAATGAAPQPVPIGGGWSRGIVGELHTVTETIPALSVRAEGVDAVILFARSGERDRAAAMVGVER